MSDPVEFHAFLGPEVNGVTIASQAVLRLADCGTVRARNISAPGKLRRLWTEVRHLFSLSPDCTLYRTLSGRYGALFDVAALAVARYVGVKKLVLHHHSYAYLNKESLIHRLAFRIAGRKAFHVVLAPEMGDALKDRYGINGPVVVADNLGLIDLVPNAATSPNVNADVLSVGILANLNLSKGGADFIRLAEMLLVDFGDRLTVQIAGPIAEELQPSVSALVARFGAQVHLWGRVAGSEKSRFLNAVDLFAFPSPNEAQPLVLYEALLAGCHVLAYRRGAIESQLQGFPLGQTVQSFEELAAAAKSTLLGLRNVSPQQRMADRQKAIRDVALERSHRAIELDLLFKEILL